MQNSRVRLSLNYLSIPNEALNKGKQFPGRNSQGVLPPGKKKEKEKEGVLVVLVGFRAFDVWFPFTLDRGGLLE